MNKKISILLSDCYPHWAVGLAAAVPLLFGVAITGIPFASFFIFSAGIITIFLIAYTAIRASQLRNSHIDMLNRRYKEDLRDFEYNFGKVFKRSFDEYRSGILSQFNEFNKSVTEQSESMRKKLHKDFEAENLVMLRTLEKKIQMLSSDKNEQLKDVVHENDLVGHGDRLREEIQKSFNKLEKSIDTSLVKQDGKLSKLKQLTQESKKQFTETLLKKDLEKFSERFRNELEKSVEDSKVNQDKKMGELHRFTQETEKQFTETLLKKDLEKFSERFRNELEKSVEDSKVNQDKKMGELHRFTQETEKQFKETLLRKDLEIFSEQFRKEIKKSIEDTIAELNGKLITSSKPVRQKSQNKEAKKTKSKTKVKRTKKETPKGTSVKKKTKAQPKGLSRKSKNESILRSTLSKSKVKKKRYKKT